MCHRKSKCVDSNLTCFGRQVSPQILLPFFSFFPHIMRCADHAFCTHQHCLFCTSFFLPLFFLFSPYSTALFSYCRVFFVTVTVAFSPSVFIYCCSQFPLASSKCFALLVSYNFVNFLRATDCS